MWIDRWENRLNAPDLLASACGAIGQAIGERVRGADSVILAGGGAMNGALAGAIEAAIGRPVRHTDEFGVPVQAREAVGMAILGALCMDGVRVTLPGVTGRSDAPLLDGCWANARIAT
jgi:anhydro-N-acetylmuramic acid kinase